MEGGGDWSDLWRLAGRGGDCIVLGDPMGGMVPAAPGERVGEVLCGMARLLANGEIAEVLSCKVLPWIVGRYVSGLYGIRSS